MSSRRPSPLLVALLLAGCADAGPGDGRQAYVFRGATMGTYFVVQAVAAELPEARLNDLRALIEGELAAVDGKMSTWDADSELSRFNRWSETTPFAASRATLEVMSEALAVAGLSGGALDITLGPLINAWGFGAQGEIAALDDGQIAGLLERVGPRHLAVDADAGTLSKARPDIYCDLSSIAKGYAVDRVTEALLGEGLADVWVEVGGEVRAAGSNPQGRVWRLGIERPEAAPGALQRIVPLASAAVATSGDYRNYRERDGARFSHIIDPRSGRPIRHRLASVSVVHPRCMRADALATALMVLGPEEGMELALREDLAVLMLVRDGDDFRELMTPRFEALARTANDNPQTPA